MFRRDPSLVRSFSSCTPSRFLDTVSSITHMPMTLNFVIAPLLARSMTSSSPFPTVLMIDILNWMIGNKLKLNQEKTEAMLTATKTVLSSVHATDLHLSSSVIPLSPSVKAIANETTHLSPTSVPFLSTHTNIIHQTLPLSRRCRQTGYLTHSAQHRLLQLSPLWSAVFYHSQSPTHL